MLADQVKIAVRMNKRCRKFDSIEKQSDSHFFSDAQLLLFRRKSIQSEVSNINGSFISYASPSNYLPR